MIIEGQFQVSASIQCTWDFLLNIERFASCIPGCQRVEVFCDGGFAIAIRQKVGPISATFDTQANLADLNPPHQFAALGKGRDMRMGSSFEFKNNMELVQIPENGTLVKYRIDVKIRGRLASVGQSMIKIVAKREIEKAVKLIQSEVGGRVDGEI